ETWVSSDIRGRGPTDFNVLRIDHNLNVTGMNEFKVRVTDIQTGMTVIKSTPIIIY
ncbi:hypothetical protein IIB79_12085, partial [candidate division KSB1 bacterium]|nr:hypothetical protein [candidate division KSB1 bacterium]